MIRGFGLGVPEFLALLSGGGVALDADAQTYITAVETADGQALEAGVRTAINAFVVGCKADGIWNAIKASCIMAGARTLNGALVPLVGAAPTSFNFQDADYDRKTGLVGDVSSKYLDSNRNNNADPQNSKHISVFMQSAGSIIEGGFQGYISGFSSGIGGSEIARSGASPLNVVASTNSLFGSAIESGGSTGFYGCSRSSSDSHIFRVAATSTTQAVTSNTPLNQNILVFARPLPSLSGYSNARIAFYSIGESLDLALLDARVTALINAFAAAIP